MRAGVRFSALPMAERCGQAARLARAVNASGRAAAMSSAFHAIAAGLDAAPLLARLTDEERAEVSGWHKPTAYRFPDGATFSYDRAVKEAELYLDHGDVRSVGHPDAYDYDPDLKRVIVVDLKRSAWTQPDPMNLQNIAALLAVLPKYPEATTFACGVWPLDGSGWLWGPVMSVDDFELATLAERVKYAATNDSANYSTGAHCSGCYSRMRCPAYLVPPEQAGEEFKALAYPDGLSALSLEERGKLVLRLKGLEENVEAMKATLAEDAKRVGGYPDGNGKVWRAVEQKGRESVSVADVRAAGRGDLVKPGKPFISMRWVRA